MLGIKEDTHLDDRQFGWLGSIFFIGYCLFQVSKYLFTKSAIKFTKYLGT